MSVDGLPNTFQDAVRIIRKPGEPYLWIDFLCVIQDDENHWAREAASMANIYGQSSRALAALDL
jgi:hypothetical protein